MKKLNLSVGQRVALENLLYDYKGSTGGVYRATKILDKVTFNEAERKKYEIRYVMNRQGGTNVNWNAKKEKSKAIDLEDLEIDLIKQLIEDKSSKGEFSLADRFLIQVAELLGIEMEEKEEKKEEK